MNIDIDSRVAILGKNGAGKSTILDVCAKEREGRKGEGRGEYERETESHLTLIQLITGKLQPTANIEQFPSTNNPYKGEKKKETKTATTRSGRIGGEEGKGEVYRHHSVSVAHFSQHHAEQFDVSLTALQFLNQTFPGNTEQTRMFFILLFLFYYFYFILFHFILFHFILFHFILFHFILFYFMFQWI